MTKDNVIYSKEFKAWFGDWENDPEHSSKVMSRGKPLAVYHGSLKLFKRFDTGKGYNVPAIWHSSNPEAASHWSGTSTVHRGEDLTVEFRNLKKQVFLLQQDGASTGKIVKVLDSFARKNLDIRVKVQETYRSREDCLKSGMDPKVFEGTTYQVDLAHRNGGETSFVVHNDMRELYTRILDYLDTEVVDATSPVKRPGEGYLYKNYLNIRNPLTVDAKGHVYYDIPFQGKRHSTESLALYAMDHGYDGVIVMNVYETDYEDVKGNDYIVFHSNQVKSATDNNGKFSPESDNIYESLENNRTEKEDNPIYTKEFKAWFGDWENDPKHSSQVIDSEGYPKIVYHGVKPIYNTYGEPTGHPNFSSFDIQRSADIGTHFSSSRDTASNFSQDEYGNEVIHPVYLNIRDLHRVSDWFSNIEDTAAKVFEYPLWELKAEGLIDAADVKKIKAMAASVDNSGKLDDRKLRTIWKELNHIVTSKNPESGLVYENIWEGGGDSYVAFNPNQIKSAVKNNGDFSPMSDNIYESRTLLERREEETIHTDAFKDWFGDWEHDPEHSSKAVDRERKPLVLYHGSSQDFDTFDPTLGREASDIQGIYLTPDAEEAGNYGDKVRAFYVNLRNPADSSTAYKVWKRYRSQGDAKAGVKAREELQSMGYDGVIWEDELYPEYVVFSANQVKSVDSKGFSSDSDNIYESRDLLDMDTEEVLDLAGRPAIYSEAFKKWFGDWENDPKHSSKMIGMNGRPKVFYHGTDREFDAFSTDAIGRSTGELGWYGKGFYFTPDYLQARHYGSKVLEVYLNIRHPFYMDSDNLRKYKDELGLTDRDLDGTDPARFLKDNRRSLRISNLLIKDGYDGIVYSEDGVSFSEVIAFNPNQIKSVDSKGFDRESDNIYEGREDSITDTLEFKRWFGDWKNDPEHASKMVDKEGRPFICYHGSHEEFSEFQDKYHWNDSGYFGKGFYFTFSDDREASKAEAKFYGPIIYECYLNIRNPFDFSQLYFKDGEKGDVDLALYNLYLTFPELDSYIKIDCDGREIGLKEYGRLYEETDSKMYLDQMVDGDYVWRLRRDDLKEDEEDYYGWTQYHTKEEAEKEKLTWLKTFLIQYENVYLYQFPYYILQASDMFSELVRKKGHDGIVQSMRGDEAVVFRPEQIKSVDNSGEFSPQSRNIYERIVRRDGKWMVTDHTGRMNLGTYDTKEEAEERLRQVEIFKHMSERFVSGIADLL